jgi:glycosyltransferase involved in cell wall biosynthesis
MIKVSIVDRTPHTRLNGVARYMLGITSLNDENIDLRVLYWGRQQKAINWHRKFNPRDFHSKLNHFNRRFLRPLGQRIFKPDIVHYPYHYLPPNWAEGPGKKVVTVHGASAFSKDLFDLERGESIKHSLQANLTSLDRIITVSEWSKAELVKYFELPESRITVIPNGVNLEDFSPKNNANTAQIIKQQYGLKEPYILNLGPGQPRKNIIRTVKGFAHLKNKLRHKPITKNDLSDLKLVISGLPGQDTKKAKKLSYDLGIDKDVIWLNNVKDRYLPYLYSGASLFLFPSLYEGFGIPLLESMACNTPVVTSNTSAIPEVVGNAATLIDPLREHDIGNACYQLLEDDTLYRSMQKKGLSRVRGYTWERCAQRHMALYREVASA